MLFLLIDKIKKYVNRASDDAHLLAIIVAFIVWISYCNYKERIIANKPGTETFAPYTQSRHINYQLPIHS
jgi:hypothetical protein